MPGNGRYPAELRERAVRMVLDSERLYGSQWEALSTLGSSVCVGIATASAVLSSSAASMLASVLSGELLVFLFWVRHHGAFAMIGGCDGCSTLG